MSLRRLNLLTLSITLLVSVLIIYLAAQLILAQSFDTLEQRYLTQNIERIQRALSDKLTRLDSTAGDYADWDDTYSFVQGKLPDYPTVNLTGQSVSNLGLNLMLFVDASDKIVYAKGYDLVNQADAPPSAGLDAHIRKGLLTKHKDLESKLTGIISLPEGIMLIASRPILTSDYKGPIAGTLVIGYYLDDSQIKALGENLNLSLGLHPLDDAALPSSVRASLQSSTADSPQASSVVDDNTINGYLLVKDIYGSPAGVVEVSLARDITAQGRTTIQYVLIALIVATVISAVGGLFITQRFIVAPTVRLNQEVGNIASKSDPSLRVASSGATELVSLATQINEMLKALQKTQSELASAEARNRAFLDAIPDLMARVKADGNVLDLRLGKEFQDRKISDIDKKNMSTISVTLRLLDLPQESIDRLLILIQQVIKSGDAASLETAVKVKNEERDYEMRIVKSGSDEVLLIARDVYARKQAEELARRGVLLREIHHRVKNNLQVVASVLNLQARQVDDEKTVKILKDSRNRIISMGLIHEKLQQSQDFVGVDFSDYIRDLMSALMSSYPHDVEAVKSKVEIDPCVLTMDKAIPCGLLLNELISNALKHAFPKGHAGELYVGLHVTDKDQITLTVRDNGVGLPTGVDIKKTESLGMQLINSLTEQLGGTVTVKNGKGTTFEVKFKQ